MSVETTNTQEEEVIDFTSNNKPTTEEGVIDITTTAEEEIPVEIEQEENIGTEVQTEETIIDNPETEVEVVEQVAQEVNDEVVLKYLSEKQGVELSSVEDLFNKNAKTTDPLENYPELKEIKSWQERTGRPVTDWVKFQKDYTSMSDEQVAREYLQVEFPDFNEEEISLELEDYLPSDNDEFSDDPRVALRKGVKLKKLASKARTELNKLRSEFDTVNPTSNSLTTEQQSDLKLASDYKEAVKKSQTQNESYTQGINQSTEALNEIKLNLGDNLEIDFKITAEDKKDIPQMIQRIDSWYNEDGSFNYDNIVQDTLKVKNFDKMLSMAYTQGKSAGVLEANKEESNITLDNRQTLDSRETESKGIIIEDAPSFGRKLKFGRRN